MNGQHLNTDPTACEARRPLRDLMLSLPHLNVRLEYHLDYESAEPALLYQIGTNADITMRTIHLFGSGSSGLGLSL